MAASLRPPILYRTSYHGIHGHEAVINRAPRRILVPAQSPFGFGADSGKVSQNEKTAQLEEEVLSKVRGAVPGSLAANKQDEIDVLVSEYGCTCCDTMNACAIEQRLWMSSGGKLAPGKRYKGIQWG